MHNVNYSVCDTPVSKEINDKFGFKKLASQIATAIVRNTEDEGTVIAINGKWGSGKSSLINLIEEKIHQPSVMIESRPVFVSRFNCWWIRGEESLISEFFRQMYSTLAVTSNQNKLELVAEMGSKFLLSSAPLLGTLSNFVIPGSGKIAENFSSFLGDSLKQTKNLDDMHSELCKMLRDNDERYLIIIDDIDRMFKREILYMFKLIKTVGHLPKFTYLIAFDRKVADEALSKKFGTEDTTYIEKFVQAGFDVPRVTKSAIKEELISRLKVLCNDHTYMQRKHFETRLDSLILPCIKSPRNLKRVINMINITWRTVEDQLDFADFVTIETFRILEPELYFAIWVNRELFEVGKSKLKNGKLDLFKLDEFKDWRANKTSKFNDNENKDFVEKLQLFLTEDLSSHASNISNIYHLMEFKMNKRLISNPFYFEKYFQFTSNDTKIENNENVLFEKCNDKEYINKRLNSIIDAPKKEERKSKLQKFVVEFNSICEELRIESNKHILSNMLNKYKFLRDIYVKDNLSERKEPNFLISELMPILQLIKLEIFGTFDEEALLDSKIETILECAGDNNSEFILDFAHVIYQLKTNETIQLSISGDFTFPSKSSEKLFELAAKHISKLAQTSNLIDSENLRRKLLYWDKFKGNKQYKSSIKFIEKNSVSDEFIVKFFKCISD